MTVNPKQNNQTVLHQIKQWLFHFRSRVPPTVQRKILERCVNNQVYAPCKCKHSVKVHYYVREFDRINHCSKCKCGLFRPMFESYYLMTQVWNL